ncbi:MAG: hypothetical protein NTX65_03190 [Ignavibacteriales bacterium]|nr:hypothetical protein [Ignavibacteriales bacterium]
MNVNTTHLAKILGITRQYVNQLVAKEGFPKAARGKYELEKAVKWYINFIKSETVDKYKEKLQRYENDDSQQRLSSYRADGALLDLLERQDKLVPTDEVLNTWKNEITILKQKLFSIPSKVSHKCLSAQSKNEINEILNQSLNEALEYYANGSINIPSASTVRNNSEKSVLAGKRTENIHQTKAPAKRK